MTDDDRAEVWLIAGFVVALTAVMVLLVLALPGPDEPEVVRVRTESVGPPATRVPPLVAGRGELVARFAPPSTTAPVTTTTTTTEPEAASSMAIEATPEGPVVVNPPEAPVGDLEALVCSYSWDCRTALAVAQCESSMRPHAVSPTNDHGLMQVNWRAHTGRVAAMGYSQADLLDPRVNLEVAWSIYAESGWGPWRYSQHCWGGAR